MDHGNALAYVQNNPDVDRLRLLYEIASGPSVLFQSLSIIYSSINFLGMEYLHKAGIVHGDLRGVRKLNYIRA